ncbi:MAG: hypothetical protein ACRC33_25085 [Gemmataceae bacterium]
MDLSAVPVSGPRDDRWTALPAGDSLRFGVAAGRWFAKPGTYSVVWEGDGFRSAPAVLRVVKKR